MDQKPAFYCKGRMHGVRAALHLLHCTLLRRCLAAKVDRGSFLAAITDNDPDDFVEFANSAEAPDCPLPIPDHSAIRDEYVRLLPVQRGLNHLQPAIYDECY